MDRLLHYIRRLEALHPLSEAERANLTQLSAPPQHHPAGMDLSTEGDAPPIPRIILSGWACRQRGLADGRRQILAFLLPGDAVGIPPQNIGGVFCSTTAITAVTSISGAAVREAALRLTAHPSGVAIACVRACAMEEARLFDHVVRLGRQSALERVAHLLLELHERLAVVGLAFENRFPMPLTQEVLADALGLSIVHVNRTLQQLRRSGLIDTRAGWVTLRDHVQMTELASFRPATQRLAMVP
ncbi:MAG: Crp/Fnr family transcriptional regulator [Caulobacter sp.]